MECPHRGCSIVMNDRIQVLRVFYCDIEKKMRKQSRFSGIMHQVCVHDAREADFFILACPQRGACGTIAL